MDTSIINDTQINKHEGEVTDAVPCGWFPIFPIDFQQSNKTLKMVSLLHTKPSNTHTALIIKVCSQQGLPGRKGPLTVTLSTLTFLLLLEFLC